MFFGFIKTGEIDCIIIYVITIKLSAEAFLLSGAKLAHSFGRKTNFVAVKGHFILRTKGV